LDLKKSSLTPPQWVFPVVWSILYIMIAVSGFIYFSKTGLTYTPGLIVYCLQIFLNVIWSPLFFWKKMITLAMVDLVALYISVVVNIYYFHKESETAAYMLIPYICWLTLAGYLNFYIVLHNPEVRKISKNN
jgi:benzodiazapine receptor